MKFTHFLSYCGTVVAKPRVGSAGASGGPGSSLGGPGGGFLGNGSTGKATTVLK